MLTHTGTFLVADDAIIYANALKVCSNREVSPLHIQTKAIIQTRRGIVRQQLEVIAIDFSIRSGRIAITPDVFEDQPSEVPPRIDPPFEYDLRADVDHR